MSSSWVAAAPAAMCRCNRIRMSCRPRSPPHTAAEAAQHSGSIRQARSNIVNSSSSTRRQRRNMRPQGNPTRSPISFTAHPPPPPVIPLTLLNPLMRIPPPTPIPMPTILPLTPHTPPTPPPPPRTPPTPPSPMLHQVVSSRRRTTDCFMLWNSIIPVRGELSPSSTVPANFPPSALS